MAFSFFGLFGSNSKKPKKQNSGFIARKITINELEYELELLYQNKTKFDHTGITSNGIDCIYFTKNKNNFDIEFEAMEAEQIPFIEKIVQFAKENGYQTLEYSYGNKPNYKSDKDAPVIKLVINSNIKSAVEIATKIQSEIFKNNNKTKYDIVP